MSDAFDHDWEDDFDPEALGDAFGDVADDLPDELETAMRDVMLKIEADAKQKANVETGNLQGSIRGVVLGMLDGVVKGVVGTPVEYAEAVHEGTPPHTITADDGVLAFDVDGETVFTKSVQHPGYEGNPFLADAIRENQDYAYQRFARAITEAEQGAT